MYSNKLEEISQRLKQLVYKLENTDYNPDELEQELLDFDKDITTFEEKFEKETGIKFDDEL